MLWVLKRTVSMKYEIYFLISQPKHMLWVLKRTVSMRRFFWAQNTYTETIKLCPLDVYACQFQMYEPISFKFSPYKLWLFGNNLLLRVIQLIVSVAADKAANTSTLKIKSHNINSLCVHNPKAFKHI